MALANPIMNPRPLEGLRTIVFDNDGVIVDSYEANMVYYGTIRKDLGLPPLTDAEKRYVHTRTHNEAMRHIVPADKLDRAFEIGRDFDASLLHPYFKRSSGLREFLWWLRDAGFNLAVNTSRGHSMGMILDLLDLRGFFQPVITSAMVSVPKPHPEGLFRIMHAHGVQPHEVAYIGDSAVDEKAAAASGVRFWAYRNHGLNAEVHIDHFMDIKAAMQRCYKGSALTF
ncbi:MAG: HAD hydrolase-like protein [Desulfovibrionaceae bacterium]|nr:HAD hydrolase-like protein [Desulfovibrionaceae bacterium]